MKPIETKQQYNEYVNKKSPDSPILRNCFNAFWVGGLICFIGQILFDFCIFTGFNENSSSTIVTIVLIGITAVLNGLNLFNRYLDNY